MTVRMLRKLIWGGGLLCLGAAAVAGTWAVQSPPTIQDTDASWQIDPDTIDQNEADKDPLPPLSDLQRLAQLPLRRALYDPPPPPPPPPKPKKDPPPRTLPIRLIGVALEPEPERSFGLFTVGGSIEIKRVGDQLETPRGVVSVTAIGLSKATVSLADQTYTLELEMDQKR